MVHGSCLFSETWLDPRKDIEEHLGIPFTTTAVMEKDHVKRRYILRNHGPNSTFGRFNYISFHSSQKSERKRKTASTLLRFDFKRQITRFYIFVI